MFRRISIITLKIMAAILLLCIIAVLLTEISPIYRFADSRPFDGPDIFNPYETCTDSLMTWKRANFHTHTRVEGPLNECRFTPAQTDSIYRSLGYDIVTFSNHNQLTTHPYNPDLQVNVYEHGYNLFKFHCLVFGSRSVCLFDNIFPILASQKQFQLDILSKGADFIQMNHPLRTLGTSKSHMQSLEGYRIIELDSGKSTENEYWDWALSSGHYSFALANDDLHFPDRSGKIAIRCNFLNTSSGTYEDLRSCLLSGGYYCMRVPDYGKGDWQQKRLKNKNLPAIKSIGLDGSRIYITLTQKADSIKFTGQDHKTLSLALDVQQAEYSMLESDSYTRITAYFPDGEVIYSNPFARYDKSVASDPFRAPSHKVNIFLTIIYNLMILLLATGIAWAGWKLLQRKNHKTENEEL